MAKAKADVDERNAAVAKLQAELTEKALTISQVSVNCQPSLQTRTQRVRSMLRAPILLCAQQTPVVVPLLTAVPQQRQSSVAHAASPGQLASREDAEQLRKITQDKAKLEVRTRCMAQQIATGAWQRTKTA